MASWGTTITHLTSLTMDSSSVNHFFQSLSWRGLPMFWMVLLPFELIQGVRGGKEGTALSMNLRPLLKAPEELVPSSWMWLWGGETRFLFGELTFTDLMGIEVSFSIWGVSSCRTSWCPFSESKPWNDFNPPNWCIGVTGELRQWRELPDKMQWLPGCSWTCEAFLKSLVVDDAEEVMANDPGPDSGVRWHVVGTA